MKMAEGLRK